MGTNVLDIAILAIMGISIFLGYRKGFLKTITGLAAILLSLVLATTFHSPVAAYLKSSAVYQKVYESTYSAIEVPEDETEQSSDFGTGKLNLPKDFTKAMQKGVDAATHSVASSLAEMVANAAVNILSMLLLFVGVRLILLLVTFLAGLFTKLPLIGWCDGLLGALFGLLRGFLMIYLVLTVATFAVTVSPDGGVAQSVKQSEFAKVMYHNNVLLDFVHKN